MPRSGRVARDIEDLRDEAAYRVKRVPLMSIALATGAGLLLGIAFAWLGRRMTQEKH